MSEEDFLFRYNKMLYHLSLDQIWELNMMELGVATIIQYDMNLLNHRLPATDSTMQYLRVRAMNKIREFVSQGVLKEEEVQVNIKYNGGGDVSISVNLILPRFERSMSRRPFFGINKDPVPKSQDASTFST